MKIMIAKIKVEIVITPKKTHVEVQIKKQKEKVKMYFATMEEVVKFVKMLDGHQ